jgi:ribonuclease P protein component
LFSKGKSISAFPIKVLYDFVEDTGEPLQAGVTASSRRFKKAVQRNRVKRVMREVYRLRKLPLIAALKEKQEFLILFFIYIGKELPVFAEVDQKMQVILQKLTDNILNKPAKN